MTRGLPIGLSVLRGTGSENQDEPSDPEPCAIVRWDAGAIDLTCTARAPAYALVTSTPGSGWSARVDGNATPWQVADVMRRGVPIIAGTHTIAWRYAAPGAFAGALVAAVGALVLVALAAINRRRRTRDRVSREMN